MHNGLMLAASAACFLLLGCLGDLGPSADALSDGAGAGSGSTTGADTGTGTGSGPSGGGPVPGGNGPSPTECTHKGAGKDYQVGPGKEYEALGDVPFESLVAGDTVRVFWREDHYHEKLMIGGQGTADQPIRVCGVPGPGGELPVIDGQDATSRPELQFPFPDLQARGVITIGHQYDAPYELNPTNIVVETLEIRNGSPPYTFTDTNGQVLPYAQPVAGIFVQRGVGITIRGCTITQNNNGIFAGSTGGMELTRDVLIEGNSIYENGGVNDASEHNTYNEVSNITYQFNYFGPPRSGTAGSPNGSNIKDRSAGTVIRYNWIEDGAHILDLVDAQEASATTVPMPSFHATYVYGNVLLRTDFAGSIVHYGGDSYVFENYRKGTLFFYNNTVIVKNEAYGDYDKPAVFELSTNEERLDARNNVFFSTVSPVDIRPIILLGSRDQIALGLASFADNWVTSGWTPFDQTPGNSVEIGGQVAGFYESSQFGTAPGFKDAAADDYTLTADAAVRGAGQPLTADTIPEPYFVKFQYVLHQAGKARADASPPTLGAFAE
jgi:hypothetical protein